MRPFLLVVMAILFITLIAPYSVLAGSVSQDAGPLFNDFCNENLTNTIIGKTPENVSHKIRLHLVFVGYDEDVVDVAALNGSIGQYYEMPYWDACLKYTFKTDYVFADESYLASLRGFVLQNSVNGIGTTSAINTTALQIQRDTGTRMSIFLPQSGRAIDARAVEQWFEDNPYDCACNEACGYTFYVLNFTEFDSPDHSVEHWFNLSRTDLDAGSVNDFWRLEWDNSLNPDVKFPYPAFTSKSRLLFADPSAFQWYLTWARIWWGLDDYLVGPKYAYYYQDLDDFLLSNDVSTSEGRSALGQYLGGWIDDFVYNLISPVGWVITGNTLSLQVLVLNDVSQYGYSNEEMAWILNSSLIEEAIKKLVPYMKVNVSIRFENLSSYPEIGETLNSTLIEEKDGWRYYDGYSLFYALQAMRDQYFYMKAAEMTVNGYVFLAKNASFKTDSFEYTGLGGLQQVLLLMSLDRFFRADGVTRKAGLSMAMIHELGHNIAFGHTFSFLRYAGDFSEDAMGYYSYFYTFCKMRTDMCRRTVVDMKLLELKKRLRTDIEMRWPWPQKTLYLRYYLLLAIKQNLNWAMKKYDRMDYLSSYYCMVEAERLEAYLQEILSGLRVPGDIDGNGKCHLEDLRLLWKAFGSTPASRNWNPEADLNRDGRVDCVDYRILWSFFGQKVKTTAGFYRWWTGAKASTVDVGTWIIPDWDVPWPEMNVTYGLQNFGDKQRSCYVRVADVTFGNLINYVKVTVYNETAVVGEVLWNSSALVPNAWVKVTLDPSVRYSLMVDVRGTAEAYYEMTVITLECKQEAPFQHPHPKQPWAELSLIS